MERKVTVGEKMRGMGKRREEEKQEKRRRT